MEIRDTKPVRRATPLRKAAASAAPASPDVAGGSASAAIEETMPLAGVPDSRLTPRVRQALLGPLGGDECGVLLVQTDEETAINKAETLAEAIRSRPRVWQGNEITLSAAYGAHSFRGTENAAEALDAADRAMYERKKKQRGDG